MLRLLMNKIRIVISARYESLIDACHLNRYLIDTNDFCPVLLYVLCEPFKWNFKIFEITVDNIFIYLYNGKESNTKDINFKHNKGRAT